MNHHPSWICLGGFLLAFALPLFASTRAAENLIADPGFERLAREKQSPAGWTASWRNTHASDSNRQPGDHKPDFRVDDTEVHSGARSVRIGITSPEDDLVLTAPLITADPKVTIYRAAVWVKARQLTNMTARLCAVYLGAQGKWLGADYGVCLVDKDTHWQRCVGLFQPVRGTQSIRLRLWVNFERKGTGVVWFDDVDVEPTTLHELPPLKYVDPSHEPLTQEDRESDYGLFARPIVETIYPDTKPRATDQLANLQMSGFPGADEAASFCVRSRRAITKMAWKVSDLGLVGGSAVIPKSQVQVHPVRCLVRQGQSRWGPVADRPLVQPVYVQQTDHVSIRANTTQQFWITLSVPRQVVAGLYQGAISLATESSVRHLRLTLSVYPFALPEVPGIAFGMYARVHPDQKLLERNFLDMRRHGMTTVGVCGNLGATISRRDGRLDLQFSENADLVRAVRAYQKAGFPEPMVWLMGSDLLHWCQQQGPLDSKEFAAAYHDALVEILRHAKEQQWPEIVFQPVDEPFGHPRRMLAGKRCLEIMKTIPGLRTEEDGPNGGPHLLDKVYDLCDVLVYHDGPWVDRKKYDARMWRQVLQRAQADRKTIWFYNVDLTGYHPEAMRFGYGFGMHAAGGTGVLEWAYMFGYRPDRPEEAYTNPNTMFFRYPTTERNVGGPSIGWEAVREGVKDYKLLRLFLREAATASASRDPKRQALAKKLAGTVQAQLARIRFDPLMATAAKGHFTGPTVVGDDGVTTVSGAFKMDNGWSFADYAGLRRILADAVVQLRE